MKLVHNELIQLSDGSYRRIQRETEVPEDRVIGEHMGHNGPMFYPVEGVTLQPGDLWHWDATAAEESANIRVLPPGELRKRSKNHRIMSNATTGEDPVTGLDLEDYAEAEGPLPQVASPQIVAAAEE
jgi:hypothetical protein